MVSSPWAKDRWSIKARFRRRIGGAVSFQGQSIPQDTNAVVVQERYFKHLIDQIAAADFVQCEREEIELQIEVHALWPTETNKAGMDCHI
jgi:hypothetical protein